jgi:hypothetical protein
METKLIRVIDVPAGATAEEAERLLNAPDSHEYFLHSIQPGCDTGTPGVAHRAFYKRRARREDS